MNLDNVQVAGNGRFIINDNIVVYDIETIETGIVYSVDWDDKRCNEEEAMHLAEAFIQKTIAGIMNNQGEEQQEAGDKFIPTK
jgi:hypothetical protein